MSAPDFYFAINAMARHIHDNYGKDVLIDYWRSLGREYHANRIEKWKQGGAPAIVQDWREFFEHEPGGTIHFRTEGESAVLDIEVCPAIKHIRAHKRDLVPYYCEHCDHVCGSMAEAAGYRFERTGGMGSCQHRYVPVSVSVSKSASVSKEKH